MRKGQGLPVNMIVLTALALLVLVVVGAFFISGFGQASSSVTIVEASQAECQGICQSITSMAYNYDNCATYTQQAGYGGLAGTTKAKEYACRCGDYGACTVTLRTGKSCSISQNTYYGATGFPSSWALAQSTDATLCEQWETE